MIKTLDNEEFMKMLIGAVPPRDAEEASRIGIARTILDRKTRHSLPRELLRWMKYDKIADPYVIMLLKMEGERIRHERPEFRYIKRLGIFDCDLDDMMEAVYFLNDYESGNPDGIVYSVEQRGTKTARYYDKGDRRVRIVTDEEEEVERNTWYLREDYLYRDIFYNEVEDEYTIHFLDGPVGESDTRAGHTTGAPAVLGYGQYMNRCMWDRLRGGIIEEDLQNITLTYDVHASEENVVPAIIDRRYDGSLMVVMYDKTTEEESIHTNYEVDPHNDYALVELPQEDEQDA